ncbi:hypothetical protein ACIPC1_17570 [Streptomyces sp. NPDC087263]|uniref:hypothetical protein n=1 Tax=Streptomyces sp. NPDC087263 TaxID=3365773 RepID=UPI0037F32856
MATAQTVLSVWLTTVIRRLPAGAVDGCCVDVPAPPVALFPLGADALAVAEGE